MKIRLIKLSALTIFLLTQLFSQVIISEVMYDPDSSDSEFVEIYNSSDSTTIDLTGWTISNNKGFDTLEFIRDSLLLLPLSYAVILESDYDTSSGVYNEIIPDAALWVGGGNTIGSGGLKLNDAIGIRDSLNTLIDTVSWTDIAPDNYSIEKVLLDQPNTEDNWKPSKDSLGTPGDTNSVTPLPIDGAIEDGITFTPTFPTKNDNVVAIVPVVNAGLNDISGTLTASVNGNVVGTHNVPTLTAQQKRNIYISIAWLPSGRHNVNFELTVAGDGDLSNNTATKKLSISYDEGVIQINEFHAEPGDGQIEFIELVVSRSIVIDGWHIADKSSSRLLPITYLEKDDYVVLASDTSLKAISNPDAKYLVPYGGLPTLNNSGDNIYLKDMNHTIIDSLVYGSGWPVVADTSAEKLRPNLVSNDPLNWESATNALGMTPGYINSNYLTSYDGEVIADSIFTVPKFPKNTEAIQLNIPITNHGADPLSGILNIYDEDNIIIQSATVSNIARRDTANFTFDLPAIPSGIHPIQIYLDVNDDSNVSNNTVADTIFVSYDFGAVLFNEFLAAPTSTQAEFVELVSFENIDFNNWSIEDATNSRKYFNGGDIPTDAFIVLSEDPAFGSIIPDDAFFVEVENFPSLNNYGDAIYLKDFTGTVIDSLLYTTWWELESGKSTEKIYPALVSNDSTAWKISIDSTGMTPGRSNSVAAKNIDGAILSELITNSPQYPANDDSFQLTIPVTNIGLQTIAGELIVEYDNLVLANYAVNNIAVGDTNYYSLDIQALASGIHSINIQLNIDNDENIDNNSAEYNVKVSYDFGAVTINEFLADPESPQAEFVELVALENVDLFEWGISDNRLTPATFGDQTIENNNYIVLSEDDKLSSLLPEEAIFIDINNFPSLNNSGDGIFLYDFTGKIIDSLNYENTNWPIESGISAEKLLPSFKSNDATRWQASSDSSGTTIGHANSATLQDVDGAIIADLISHYPEFPHPSESSSFSIAVHNAGINTIGGNVSIIQDNTELGTGSFNNLLSEDTTFVSFNINPLQSGNNELIILIEVDGDMNEDDNQMDYNIYVSYSFGTVVFNEFLAKPDTTQAEFVEIVSFSNIDLTDWSISDNTFKPYYFDEFFASANEPIVITSDSSFAASLETGIPVIIPINGWPILNNEEDGIYLYDATGAVIDSLKYTSDWPITDGRSTEKYRPNFESYDMNRWGIAVNAEAMTPGQKNSLYFDELPDNGKIEFETNPFSPDGDGFDDELLIKYKLPFEQGIIKLQIFDMAGRNIATPYWNVYFPQEGILKWGGTRDNGEAARIGIYIIKITARDASGNNTWEKVKTVVLAKKL